MSSTEQFDFQEQLKVGSRGEELFLQYYHSPIVIYPERRADFRRVTDNKLVELKTDTYNMEKTPNFFFERWSNVEEKKPGGPWQSRKNRVDIYCYMFVRHNRYFEFLDIPALCSHLEQLIEDSNLGMVWVKNKGWITGGYRIPRLALKDWYKEYSFVIPEIPPA